MGYASTFTAWGVFYEIDGKHYLLRGTEGGVMLSNDAFPARRKEAESCIAKSPDNKGLSIRRVKVSIEDIGQ